MANKARGERINCFGGGRHDSRLAMAHDTCADSSCLDVNDVKSPRFVALVLQGRDGCKDATQPTAWILTSERLWHFDLMSNGYT